MPEEGSYSIRGSTMCMSYYCQFDQFLVTAGSMARQHSVPTDNDIWVDLPYDGIEKLEWMLLEPAEAMTNRG